MAFDSFRDWVNALDRAGELIRIAQPVATELEITELADREMKSPGRRQGAADREAHRQRAGLALSRWPSTPWAPGNAWRSAWGRSPWTTWPPNWARS